MPLTAADVAKQLQGEVIGDPGVALTGFSPAASAKSGDLTFAENETYFARAEQSLAAAILVDRPFATEKKVIIRVPNARIAFARVLPLFFPDSVFQPGIHPSAVIDPTAIVDSRAHIGPGCHLAAGVRVGARVVLEGGDYIGVNSTIGDDSHLFPNVTLYPKTQIGLRVRIHAGSVIGSDGFGYVLDAGVHRKVPQIGFVIIQDEVEIGASVCVDRGALGPTVIGRGTKIDNLVQIAHNVVVGENTLIVAQAGVAGSTKIGAHVTVAGQAGLAGHLKIGNRVTITAQSGVMHDIPDGEKWFGSPAQPDRQMKRQLIAIHQLPDLLRRVAELERRLTSTESTPSEVREEPPSQ